MRTNVLELIDHVMHVVGQIRWDVALGKAS